MKVSVLDYGSLVTVYEAVGVCRNSKNKMDALHHALKSGHDSLLEHWVISFNVEGISRACSHQLVRHRIGWSYAQQSQRHVQVAEGHDWYVVPPNVGPEYHQYMEVARQSYLALLNSGIPKEDARYVLPNACKTNIVITANARALDNFFKLRCCKQAQWEIRTLAKKMLHFCVIRVPELFNKPYPDCSNCTEQEKCADSTKE